MQSCAENYGYYPHQPLAPSPLPSPQHHSTGNAHYPEQIQPQAGVIADIHRPISRPFPRVHRRTHRNLPMVPKQNPHQCSATSGGLTFRAHPSRLSGTRCLPMVPLRLGEGRRGGGRSAWVIAVGKAPTSQKLPLLENGQIRAYLVEHRDLHQ